MSFSVKEFPSVDEVRLNGKDGPASTIAHFAATRAGWHQPFCPWVFDLENHGDLRPLATLDASGKSFIVGVTDAGGTRAFLPVYAITPYLFAGDDRIESPHEPALDSKSEAILNAALQALEPVP